MKTFLTWVIVLAIIIGGFVWYSASMNAGLPNHGELDEFAVCTKDAGAIMYGAYWCPHCKEQKKRFGSSVDKINYVECTENEAICTAMNIRGYPTWIFADGTRHEGEIALADLASKTACELPAEFSGL